MTSQALIPPPEPTGPSVSFQSSSPSLSQTLICPADRRSRRRGGKLWKRCRSEARWPRGSPAGEPASCGSSSVQDRSVGRRPHQRYTPKNSERASICRRFHTSERSTSCVLGSSLNASCCCAALQRLGTPPVIKCNNSDGKHPCSGRRHPEGEAVPANVRTSVISSSVKHLQDKRRQNTLKRQRRHRRRDWGVIMNGERAAGHRCSLKSSPPPPQGHTGIQLTDRRPLASGGEAGLRSFEHQCGFPIKGVL